MAKRSSGKRAKKGSSSPLDSSLQRLPRPYGGHSVILKIRSASSDSVEVAVTSGQRVKTPYGNGIMEGFDATVSRTKIRLPFGVLYASYENLIFWCIALNEVAEKSENNIGHHPICESSVNVTLPRFSSLDESHPCNVFRNWKGRAPPVVTLANHANDVQVLRKTCAELAPIEPVLVVSKISNDAVLTANENHDLGIENKLLALLADSSSLVTGVNSFTSFAWQEQCNSHINTKVDFIAEFNRVQGNARELNIEDILVALAPIEEMLNRGHSAPFTAALTTYPTVSSTALFDLEHLESLVKNLREKLASLIQSLKEHQGQVGIAADGCINFNLRAADVRLREFTQRVILRNNLMAGESFRNKQVLASIGNLPKDNAVLPHGAPLRSKRKIGLESSFETERKEVISISTRGSQVIKEPENIMAAESVSTNPKRLRR